MHGLGAHRILVPLNGATTDEDALRLGCRIAKREKAEVAAVTVIELRRSIALGTVDDPDVNRAETLLTDAEAIAAEHDAQLHTEILQAREAGPAICDEALDWRADLLVIGMPFRERFGELYMGKTVPYVMREARCQVLIYRAAP